MVQVHADLHIIHAAPRITHVAPRKATVAHVHLTYNKMVLTKALHRIVCSRIVCRKSAHSKTASGKMATLPTHASDSTCSAMVCICSRAL